MTTLHAATGGTPLTPRMPLLRLARHEDLERINAIYNHFVLHSTCTYQETPEPMEKRQAWFEHHGPAYPVIVVEVAGEVVAWGSLSPFHTRSAWRFTVENSIYIDQSCHGQGIGTAILQDLIFRAKALGYRTIIASIDGDQAASLALHAKCGFVLAGRLHHVGFKFNRWLDAVYMELQLPLSPLTGSAQASDTGA